MLTAALPYDPHTAFAPIIHVANLPAVVLIRSSLPYATLPEFVAAAKQQPGKFNYASAGPGNWTHLFMATARFTALRLDSPPSRAPA